MSDLGVLGENGVVEPVSDVAEWSIRFDWDNRHVAKDQVGKYLVSTVFLGLNHGFGGSPLWFETMIFGGGDTDYQTRCETIDQAKEMHAEALAWVRKQEES